MELTGIGGIGKTALAGRVIGRLAQDGWLVAEHTGGWNPDALFASVAIALEADPELAGVVARLRDRQVEGAAKLAFVRRLVAQRRVVLLFDDFEQNLDAGGGRFTDPGFAEAFTGLVAACRAGKVLVTCRYPVPGEMVLHRVAVPALTSSELGRLMLRLPALRALDPADRRVVAVTVGGHPRLIEFVDALLRGGQANLTDVVRKLRRLAAQEGLNVRGSRAVDQAVRDAVRLGSRDILLDALLTGLTRSQQGLLLQAAVSTASFTGDDLAVALHGPDTTGANAGVDGDAADGLDDVGDVGPAGQWEPEEAGELDGQHAWGGRRGDGHIEDRDAIADARMPAPVSGFVGFAELGQRGRLSGAGRPGQD